MAGNTFGQLFRITTFGESHGGAVGCVIDGCPPKLAITPEDIQKELDRRKPGQSEITTPRAEKDKVIILSGVYEGLTTGAPILLLAQNEDIRPEDYDQLKRLYRPGHADYTFQAKYGIRDWRGSGRASARETLARVAAGAIAKKYLEEKLNIQILSYVQQVGDIEANVDNNLVSLEQVESNIIRCPDNIAANEMIKLVEEVRDSGDSVGGIIVGLIKNCPVGLGEPVFDKLNADLGKAMLSINAVKGFDIGSGFRGADMRGSEHNDEFYSEKDGRIRTKTNNAGGTLGGISNGEDIYFRVAIKPVSTISKKQNTLDLDKNEVEVEATGRHDPCVLPRAIPIVDAMSALTIMDHYLRNKAQNG
ncbi:MAG TPA: chorismate synthase [Candidatus Saccharimonadales bacterium]|nr:chorismate synthase [Candidatus Saccharimonadales bacterium]